jgi:hypothetical protein
MIKRTFCKRTFMEDGNIYFIKNKTYEMLDPKDYEEGFGVYKKVKSEKNELVPLSKKTFDKFFCTIEDNRDEKITQILRNDND